MHRFAYPDRPWNPREEVVTDPLNVVSTVSYAREPGSNLPLALSTSGECPSCGVGPNSQNVYGDARNPTLPTQTIDAGGVATLLEYDDQARLVARTEAFGRALERTTTWSYDPDHPALPATVEQPAVQPVFISPRRGG